MRIRHLLATSAVALAGVAALPASSLAAAPLPFGHACTPKDGALQCPTTDLTDRVPSFDGVPLDVDVWLPASGDGPFPTIAMLHGYGGDKGGFQSNNPSYSAQAYARKGYAVVVPSARGFGRSCGVAASRTVPACDKGYIHTDDTRYEIRDVQTLLGTLVDQGVAKADALASTGISYGGIASLQLAYLKNRVRLPDGTLQPWVSPLGKPLSLTVAWPRWPGSDLADSLVPNGRAFITGKDLYGYASPDGVGIKSYTDGLYNLGKAVGFVAAPGADASADLTVWYNRINKGEPYDALAHSYIKQLHDFHGASGIPISAAQMPAPLLIQNGWTDELFPAWQGVRPFEQVKALKGVVGLQLGDLGHSPATNFAKDNAAFEAAGLTYFEHFLKGAGAAPKNDVITAYGSNCTTGAKGGIGPWAASSVAGLAKASFTLPAGKGKVTSSGGDAALAKKLDPLSLKFCKGVKVAKAPGTVQIAKTTKSGFTLLGPGTIQVAYKTSGKYAQIVARLWDRNPKTGTSQLVDRSVTRLPAAKSAALKLNGNGWKFPKGHQVVVELVGRDAPTYRPSNGSFSVSLSSVKVTLPTR